MEDEQVDLLVVGYREDRSQSKQDKPFIYMTHDVCNSLLNVVNRSIFCFS